MGRPGTPFLKPTLLFLIISLVIPAHQLNVEDLTLSDSSGDNSMMQHNETVNVGVVIDMGSWIGKSIHSCMKMAISDFYASKHQRKTRLVLHTRDSRGDLNHSISSAVDLLGKVKVQALIMGPETVPKTKYLGTLGNKAKCFGKGCLDEAIVWPGITTTAPRGMLMPANRTILRIGVPINEGFEQFIMLKHKRFMGFCVDVFSAVLDSLPYQVDYEFIPWLNSNGDNQGSYNNLVYQVHLGIQLGSEAYIGTHDSIIGQTIAYNLNFKDNRLKMYETPEEYADALSRGSKKGGVDAIIDEIPYLKVFLAKYEDEYAMVATQSTTNGFGFAFNRKYAQLVSDMSDAIIKLREEGKLAAIENLWLNSGSSFMPESTATQPDILNLRSFGGLFLISFACCVFVLLIHLISILQNKLDYLRNLGMVVRDGGILAYMINRIVPSHICHRKRTRRRGLTAVRLLLPAHELSSIDADFALSDHSDNSSMMTPQQTENVNVGVVIDMGSWIGKSIHSCIEMAISDFCALKLHCNETRFLLHTRDSRGDPKHAISSADEYPFFIQINQDEKLQFKAIASILISHQWKTVSVIYDDTDDGRYSILSLVGSFQERGIRVSHRTAVSPFSNDDQILDELHKLSILQQSIFVVHLSASTTYRLFSMAKRLGMMKEGYAWIVTDRTMNQLQYGNGDVIRSMQGVVGLKAYIPSSSKLQDFSLKWKKGFYSKNASVEFGELNVLGIWAYDTIWALAEKLDRHEYSSVLLIRLGSILLNNLEYLRNIIRVLQDGGAILLLTYMLNKIAPTDSNTLTVVS
ncbi:OLC1v1006584C1 [Oldenlandia corymbosa var. corymbosa]|uniref:OLC1v1006584C1 n=1 Tax=Oldenlandia corymbosa var. corymbosa TaxID=529605 RepID=A0AAV1DIU6_OLDCO|nr:OLC1v1006584C1 [Oldenlandia corymbosa var. corymbosa]